MAELAKTYDPKATEERWYQAWLKGNYFHADENGTRPRFSMVIPPPNVTGSLHLGHALNNTLQDLLARHKRLQGCDVLWLPGTDHAGISTQVVVERELKKQGLTRHDLGRERFVDQVWEWKARYGARIVEHGTVLAFEQADGAQLLFDAGAWFHALLRIHGCLRFLFRSRRMNRGGADGSPSTSGWASRTCPRTAG